MCEWPKKLTVFKPEDREFLPRNTPNTRKSSRTEGKEENEGGRVHSCVVPQGGTGEFLIGARCVFAFTRIWYSASFWAGEGKTRQAGAWRSQVARRHDGS